MEFRVAPAIFRASSTRMPILKDLSMSLDSPANPESNSSQLDSVGDAVRWTLGNLDQAFDQALDEAFRTCTTIHTVIRDELRSVSDAEGAAGEQGGVAAEVGRFRSCEGPIADGEPGEGLGAGAVS
ncbi:MAG: hypothetical protein RLY21_380 [Planctomycetota bacterium]|jgi:hypothetical protein